MAKRNRSPENSFLVLRRQQKMARSERRVSSLAMLADLSPKEAISKLRNVGIQVSGASDLIPKRDLLRVFKALEENSESQTSNNEPEIVEQSIIPNTSSEEKQIKSENIVSDSDLVETGQPTSLKLKIIGRVNPNISYLSVDQVVEIHNELVKDFNNTNDPIDPPGVKSETLLGSAVNRPHTSIDDTLKYPTVYMVAAAYLHALIGNHPFHNGNKRTALVSTLAFLDSNHETLDGVSEDDLYDYVIKISAHEVVKSGEEKMIDADAEMNAIASWLRKHSRPISTKDQVLKVHELLSILKNFGCDSVERKHGNKAAVKRRMENKITYVSHFGYKNEGDDLDKETVRRVRKDLRLTKVYGVDSKTFYMSEVPIPAFINKYRNILQRLANT